MPAYSYVALNRNGSKKKGIVSAESEREARRLIKDLKLTPLKVTESKDLGKTLRIKNKDVVLMTRQLATLLEASTPLVESIDCLLYTSPSPRDDSSSRKTSSA